jgi:PhnB protein
MTSTLNQPTPSTRNALPTAATAVLPYLFFEGRCDEALEFYQRAVGATVTQLMRYRESPAPEMCNGSVPGDKVMHASFRIGTADILASDGNCSGKPAYQGFGLSLTVATPADAERLFNGLRDGGEVRAPLSPTFFSPSFGMVSDRFGILWMVYVAPQPRN